MLQLSELNLPREGTAWCELRAGKRMRNLFRHVADRITVQLQHSQ